MKTKQNEVVLMLDSCRGVYIPKNFAKEIIREPIVNREYWEPILDELMGMDPADDSYWDIWADILDNLRFDYNGEEWSVYQDGDVWLIPASKEEEFFGKGE